MPPPPPHFEGIPNFQKQYLRVFVVPSSVCFPYAILNARKFLDNVPAKNFRDTPLTKPKYPEGKYLLFNYLSSQVLYKVQRKYFAPKNFVETS